MKETQGQSRRKKSDSRLPLAIGAGVLVAAVIGFGIYYYTNAVRFRRVFLPGTYINGITAEYRTPEEVMNDLRQATDGYSITIRSRGRADEVITKDQIGFELKTDYDIHNILAEQNIFTWMPAMNRTVNYTVGSAIKMERNLFNDVILDLPAFDNRSAQYPTDARLGSYNRHTGCYEIIPEDDGNILEHKNEALEAIRTAMLNLQPEIDLDAPEYDFYMKAAIRSDNPYLTGEKELLDKTVASYISYKDSDLTLDSDTLSSWLSLDGNGNVVIDDTMVRNFAEVVGNTYDTVDKDRILHTSWNTDVKVSGGSYGRKVDQEAEAAHIRETVAAGKREEDRVPEMKKTTASMTDPEWGDTYVEVNITQQHLYFYKNGVKVIDTDFVSGATELHRGTPTGIYSVAAKQTDRTLRGRRRSDGSYEYESHVNFWMPFNGGVGLHDATWRGSFGGTIYKRSGSHGCVNLPYKAAQTIYQNIEVGTPVIVYNEDGSVTGPIREEPLVDVPAPAPVPQTQAPEPETVFVPRGPGDSPELQTS